MSGTIRNTRDAAEDPPHNRPAPQSPGHGTSGPDNLSRLRAYYMFALGVRIALLLGVGLLGALVFLSLVQLNQRYDTLNNQLLDIPTELDNLARRVNDLPKHADIIQTLSTRDKETLDALKDGIDALKQADTALEQRQRDLQAITDRITDLKDLSTSLKNVKDPLDALEKERKQWEDSNNELKQRIASVTSHASHLQNDLLTLLRGEPPKIAFVIIDSEATDLKKWYPALPREAFTNLLNPPPTLRHAELKVYVASGHHLTELQPHNPGVPAFQNATGTRDEFTTDALETLKDQYKDFPFTRVVFVAAPSTTMTPAFADWASDNLKDIQVNAILIHTDHHRYGQPDISRWSRFVGQHRGTMCIVSDVSPVGPAPKTPTKEDQQALAQRLRHAAERVIGWPWYALSGEHP